MTIAMGFLLGTLKISDFPSMMISSAKVNGVILPIVAFSLPLSQAMAVIGVPQGFVYAMTTVSENPVIIILLMISILIIAGCVMETTPNIVILAPLMFPLTQEIGMNDVQFCIMMITTLGVGFITPPLGLNLFVVSGLTGESILKIAYRAIPFMVLMLVVVLMIAFIPAISTNLLAAALALSAAAQPKTKERQMATTYLKKSREDAGNQFCRSAARGERNVGPDRGRGRSGGQALRQSAGQMGWRDPCHPRGDGRPRRRSARSGERRHRFRGRTGPHLRCGATRTRSRILK